MKQILAFGDSNTWGLVPGSKPHKRYPWGKRWTSILQEKYESSDVRIMEEGLCGRTTVFEDELRPGRKGLDTLSYLIESHYPLDAMVLMLGTNDCKSSYNASPYTIGLGIEKCLDIAEKYVKSENIVLVSPISLGDEVYKPEKDPEFDKQSIEKSGELKDVYRQIASKRGVRFLAASDYVEPSHVDDEHMDEKGHSIFADVIYDKLQEII